MSLDRVVELGRREQTKAANRAAILAAGREVFAEIGYGAATVRDIVRGTSLATGTFYNYFPDKESVFRALLDESVGTARQLARSARRAAATPEAFVTDAYRAYFRFLADDPQLFMLLRRNAGTVTTLFAEGVFGVTVDELAEDMRDAVARGVLPPGGDVDYLAAAMVGTALEVGVKMVERDPPDVDGASAFAAGLFLGAFALLKNGEVPAEK